MTEFNSKNCKFLVLLFHICVSQIFYATACPLKCKCYFDEQRVDCAGAGLSRLPDEIPSWVESLDLRRNFLRSIDIPTLKQFSSLHTLFLMDNEIRHLDADILDELPRLRRLYLGRNQIRNLPALSLLRLSDIRVLDFHANHLRHVDANAFAKLHQLERVNLQKNFLQSLPHDLFSSNRLLKSVRLSHNPWNCDCRLWSTAEFLNSQPFLEKHHENDSTDVLAKCQNPGHLRSLPLRDLTHDQAKCYNANIQKVDRALQLDCNVDNKQQFSNLLEPSKTTVQWLYGDSSLEESLNGEYEILSNGTLLLYNGKLEIQQFKCAINYVVSPARLTRHLQRFNPNSVRVTTRQHSPDAIRAPRFTYSLKERRYREGSAAKLNCEVIGTPRPQILWTFNDHPIEASRKYELHRDSTELVIYPFLEHDVGTYACEAVNVHGRIRSVARIGLIKSSPPVITEGPKAATVRVGQRALFKCKARGEPRPDITWFFDGSEIPPELKGHYQVSDDGTELVIAQVSRQDQGTYSCMAGNPVGSMTGTAQLDVHSSTLDALDRQLQRPDFLKNIVGQASENVNRAIQETRASFSKRVETNPQNLLRHFKFAARKPVELSRAREIYEESLRLLAKHVDLGIQFDPSILPTNVSYESVLSVTHIQTIMELSGCMNGQFKDSCSNMCFHSKYRSYTGQCNNFEHPTWGVSQMPFHRLLPPIYENGFNTPVSWDPTKLYFGFPKPNPRTVSIELIGTEVITPHNRFSSMLMQWGQFLDHDLDFTATALARQTYAGGAICNKTCENIDPCFNIPLPLDDPRRKTQHGMKYPCIEFERSAAICGSGETSPIFKQVTYREQTNIITSYIDGSGIYGSTEVDAIDLRDLYSDHGLLRFDIVSAAQKPYMPFEKDSSMDCRRNFSVENPIRCFLAGDFRANEQLGLTSMHTVWFREHNRIATKLLEMNPDWDGERIYQETRKILGAMLQHITYTHWLPKVLGQEGYDALIGNYKGYDPEVNPSIANAFATAAFRFGHTLINPKLERLDENFESLPVGPLPLHEAFFAPERLLAEGGVDPLLRGLFASPLKQPMTSQLLNKELTERLFHRAHNVSLDLAVMNIQRGRDHALPGYIEYRKFCNLTVPRNWAELALDIGDQTVMSKLERLYGHVGNIDLWVGGIVEKHLPDALIGATFSCIIADQFRRLRTGDRFWYENAGVFTPLQLNEIKKASMAKILCNNGDAIDRVQPDVFLYVNENKLMYKKCEMIPDMNLKMWMSCCDDSCSAAPSAEPTDAPRLRRSHHLYTPLQTPSVKGCEWNGTKVSLRAEWKENCSLCRCQDDGMVWCTSIKDCYD